MASVFAFIEDCCVLNWVVCSLIRLVCLLNSTSNVVLPTCTFVPSILTEPSSFIVLITESISSFLPLILAFSETFLLSIAPSVIPALWTPLWSISIVLPSEPLTIKP